MFSYENGVMIACLLWVWTMIHTLVMINSQLEKNLNRIGRRLSWFWLSPKEMYMESRNRPLWKSALKFIAIAFLGIPSVLLSWAWVIYWIGTVIYGWNKKFGMPQAMREFHWKMRNIDMPFDRIVKELMAASYMPETDFEDYKHQILREMEDNGVTP